MKYPAIVRDGSRSKKYEDKKETSNEAVAKRNNRAHICIFDFECGTYNPCAHGHECLKPSRSSQLPICHCLPGCSSKNPQVLGKLLTRRHNYLIFFMNFVLSPCGELTAAKLTPCG